MAKNFTFRMDRFGTYCPTEKRDLYADPAKSPDTVNFTVSKDGFLKKREGYSVLARPNGKIRAIGVENLGGREYFLAVIASSLYVSERGFDSLRAVSGTVTGEGRVQFYSFYDGIYLMTGEEILCFNGTDLEILTPHVPLVMISTDPYGEGILYEEPNLLTNRVRQSFSPDGESRHFYPVLPDIQSVEWVKIGGETVPTEEYYWDGMNGCLVFLTEPDPGTDTMEVQMIRRDKAAPDRIQKCRFACFFGGANDTRAFLYGNPDTPAIRYHSGMVEGKPAMNYFPETAYSLVGGGSTVTAVLRHYDRQLIFTENAAYYSYLEYLTGENGKLIAAFPVLPLSDDRGNVPEGQAILAENTPYTLSETGLYRWVSTSIRDERNARCVSDPIAKALQKENCREAILFYRKAESELLISFGTTLYVYRERQDLFCRYEVPDLCGFAEWENKLYFFTDSSICLVGGESDAGAAVSAHWESGLMDFGSAAASKNLFWLNLLGESEEDMAVKITLLDEKDTVRAEKSILLKGGVHFSSAALRLPLRRIRLLRLRLELSSKAALSIREIRAEGRITDKKE